MQIGFYFDQTRCTGCSTCSVACKDWHDVPAGPVNWCRIKEIEKGTYPHLFLAFALQRCWHCIDAPCVEACPAGAIEKRAEDGVVTVDRDACLGKHTCDTCLQSCPHAAPQFGPEEHATMQKCDFCIDKLAEEKQPICVAGCPMRALDAGPLEDLIAKYGDVREAEGFFCSAESRPALVIKPKPLPAFAGGKA